MYFQQEAFVTTDNKINVFCNLKYGFCGNLNIFVYRCQWFHHEVYPRSWRAWLGFTGRIINTGSLWYFWRTCWMPLLHPILCNNLAAISETWFNPTDCPTIRFHTGTAWTLRWVKRLIKVRWPGTNKWALLLCQISWCLGFTSCQNDFRLQMNLDTLTSIHKFHVSEKKENLLYHDRRWSRVPVPCPRPELRQIWRS